MCCKQNIQGSLSNLAVTEQYCSYTAHIYCASVVILLFRVYISEQLWLPWLLCLSVPVESNKQCVRQHSILLFYHLAYWEWKKSKNINMHECEQTKIVIFFTLFTCFIILCLIIVPYSQKCEIS